MSLEEFVYFGISMTIGYAFGCGIWLVSFSIRYMFKMFKMMASG
jgi:hypothetical protein